MVLQRDMKVPVWGWSDPGGWVSISFLNETYKTKADKNGKWSVKLKQMKAGGPHEMVIKGKNTIIIKNILIGDIWICGGQSNMEMPMKYYFGKTVLNAAQEIQSANYLEVRVFKVKRNFDIRPTANLNIGDWKKAVGANIKDFSAVGYFFGREIHREFNIPIGLISSNWGGTPIELWTRAEALKNVSDFRDEVKKNEKMKKSIEELTTEVENDYYQWVSKFVNKAYEKCGINILENNDVSEKDWNEIYLPIDINNNQVKKIKGVYFLRKKVNISKSPKRKELTLLFGRFRHVFLLDKILFNGYQLQPDMKYFDLWRSYTLPSKFVKVGENLITAGVIDVTDGGIINGTSSDLFLITDINRESNYIDGISLAGKWQYQLGCKFDEPPPPDKLEPQKILSSLYNGMINPIVPYGIKGVIWYQGETNASRAYQYRSLFPIMIKDWRKQWGQGDFPFLFVQLANYHAPVKEPGESEWGELREAQSMTLSLPNTGMAVAIDIGEADNIHPVNKQDVGKRLALAAQKIAYNQDIVYSGPIYESMEIEGNKIRIEFEHRGSGLIAQGNGGILQSFAIAGEDRKFEWAQAVIEDNTVVVYSEKVEKPVAVRYAWADNPEDANLYNKEGLPASPFRTDNWPGITVDKK